MDTEPSVLLVESHMIVRGLLVQCLKGLGYTVCVAEDAQGALAMLRTAEALSMLVSDWDLGQLNAAELVRELRRTHPSLPAVVVSWDAELLSAARLGDRVVFLAKPFTFDDLRTSLVWARKMMADQGAG